MNAHTPIIKEDENPIYALSLLDRITVGGVEYVWVSSDSVAHVLAPKSFPDHGESFPHGHFRKLLLDEIVTVEHDYYARGKAAVRTFYEDVGLRDLEDDVAAKANFYADVCDEFLRMEAADRKVTLSQKSLERVLPQIEANLRDVRKKRGGRKRVDFDMPTPRHFRRILKTYVEAGYQAIALASRCRGPKSRASSVAPHDLEVWAEFAYKYADRRKPKMSGLLRDLKAAIEQRNPGRIEKGLPPLTKPSRKRFEKLIHGLDPFMVTARREGEAAARAKFRITYQGLEVEAPLKRVEMDEWKIDLMTLLVHLRVWERMDDAERAAVKRSRLWVTVAIDCATRYLLALKFFSRAPNADSATATLEMAVMDKSRLKFLLGTTSWIGHGIPEQVVTDGGPAFVSFEFRSMLRDLGVSHSLPPAGEAKLRPYVESVIKTLSVQFLHWFEGRTFSDYIEKGDYDPEKNASICVDELNRDFVVGVQHIYNNQPHASLAGETPHNAYLRLSRKYGVIPPPPRDLERHVFGINCCRTIGDKGICILGIHYNSRELQQLRMSKGQTEVRVRFNRFDASRISVWNDIGWLTVDSSFGLPEDLSIWEWVGAAQELRRIHAENAKENLSSMYEAINRLRASGDAAAARAELGASVLSEKRIKEIEQRHFRGITFVDDQKATQVELVPLESPPDPLMAGIDAFPDTFSVSAGEEEQIAPDTDLGDEDGELQSQLGEPSDLKFDDD